MSILTSLKNIFSMKKSVKKTKTASKPAPKKAVKKVVKKSVQSQSSIDIDKSKKAKPVGYRYEGKGIYDKPTMEDIKRGWGWVNGRKLYVYYEGRPTKSDKSLKRKI